VGQLEVWGVPEDELVAQLAAELQALSMRPFGGGQEDIGELAPILRSLGEMVRERHPEQNFPDAAAAARWYLVATLDVIDNPDYRFLIDVGLGLTVRAGSYTARHKEAEKAKLPGYIALSTAERRRDEPYPVFARRLIDLADETGPVPAEDANASPFPYTVERTTVWVRFGAGRRFERLILEVSVIAHQPGRHVHPTHNQYFADERPGVVEVVPLVGCDLVGEQRDSRGVHYSSLRMRNELARGDQYSFMYELRANSQAEMDPTVMIEADTNGREAIFNLDFADGEVPASVSRFAGLTSLQAREEDRRHQGEQPLDRGNVAQVHHADLERGLCYGVAWSWTN
jgi:hypothetical protein